MTGGVPVMRCPACQTNVPAGAFCGTCGAQLSASHGARSSLLRPAAYAAAPGEHVLRLSVASSLFPHLPHRSRAPFRVALVVLFLTLIAEKQGWFTLKQLLGGTRRKMVRRHPHVFGNAPAPTPETAYQSWQASKRREGKRGHSPTKAFRRQLVASWDRRLTGRSKRPSGSSARSKTRSPGRG